MTGFPEEKVRKQVDRILTSPEFKNSKKLCQFLNYVVGQMLSGNTDGITQYAIAVEGLGYGKAFDPTTTPNIRVLARRIRRALDQYYNTHGVEDPFRIEIPKGNYVPTILPNPGIPQNSDSTYEPSCSISAAMELKGWVPGGPSIAILPMEYLGNDPEHTFIASGISEEIVVALTRFQDFFVVGPLDRDIIHRKQLGPRAIGKEYCARFLLDGTIRLRGRTLRLTTKLTDTLNGRKVWGQVHEHDIEKTSVDEVEHEIVSQVVTTIADNFGVIPRTLAKEVLSHQDDSLSDYAAVLLFHHHVRVLTEESLTQAIEALEKVVQRDPGHDLALALLGDLISTPYWLGYIDSQYDLGRALELGKRALALNPNSQPARMTMAINYYLTFQKALCLKEIEQALYLNPNNANYLANSALFLMGTGQYEEGLTLVNKAMRWNPHHPGWYHIIPFLYHYHRDEFKSALVEANGFNTPDYFWDPLIRAAVLGQLGHQEEAEKATSELLTLVPDFDSRGRSLILRMLFQTEHVETIWEGLQKAGIKEFA